MSDADWLAPATLDCLLRLPDEAWKVSWLDNATYTKLRNMVHDIQAWVCMCTGQRSPCAEVAAHVGLGGR